jgi:hypothetical protein
MIFLISYLLKSPGFRKALMPVPSFHALTCLHVKGFDDPWRVGLGGENPERGELPTSWEALKTLSPFPRKRFSVSIYDGATFWQIFFKIPQATNQSNYDVLHT